MTNNGTLNYNLTSEKPAYMLSKENYIKYIKERNKFDPTYPDPNDNRFDSFEWTYMPWEGVLQRSKTYDSLPEFVGKVYNPKTNRILNLFTALGPNFKTIFVGEETEDFASPIKDIPWETCKKLILSTLPEEMNIEFDIIPYVHDYSQDYFTFVALEDGIISFTLFSWADTTFVESFAYSKNSGEWVETQNSDDRENDIKINVNVVKGDKVRWKGIANHIGCEDDNGGVFTSTCRVNVQGNIMSLLYGDYFNNELTLGDNFVFSHLFIDISSGIENKCIIVNASDLVLPATTLTNYCYEKMFMICTSLTSAPSLPATTLANYCYDGMFQSCTSLTSAPKLPATTLADGCYKQMFQNCTNLVTAPELPATTLADLCYHFMFSSCTSLNYIKAMFTTTPGDNYTSRWVSSVSATGKFVMSSDAHWNVRGVNGIPTGWIVLVDTLGGGVK